MKIKVTETKKASHDGVTVVEYEKGKTYEMPPHVGQLFIDNKWGTDASKKKPGPTEDKKADGANENKDDNQQPPANNENEQA